MPSSTASWTRSTSWPGRLKTASNEFGENLADRVLEAAERSADWKEDWEAAAEEWSQRRAEFQVQLAQKREQMEDELRQHAQEQAVRLQEGHDNARAELDAWREKLQTQLDSRVFGQRRLMAAFPKMRSTRHRQAMEQLRRRMERRAPSKRK